MNRAKSIVLLLTLFLCVGGAALAQGAPQTPPVATPAPAAEPQAAAAPAAAPAAAAEPTADTGDTAWMLTSAALVLFMTIPGLFLFYGGLVRSKNVLGMFMQNFIMVGLITVQWIVIGYSLAFSNGSSFLGGFQWAGFRWRRSRTERGLRRNDPAPDVHVLSAHVRHHYARIDDGRLCGADEVLNLHGLLPAMGHVHL